MARGLSRRAQAAVETLQQVPARLIDRVFVGFGTLAAIWLAFLLLHQLLTDGRRYFWAFVPFWLLVTYLILPRIHSVLSRIYLPDYFIGRTRTREGVLGDPVNIAALGTEEQIHTAMIRAGWRRADDLAFVSGLRTVGATLTRRSYPDAPVSALFLFGERQAFTYQQEVEGNPAKRHHVRFWRTPEGWLLPGGRRVDWLAAGTYDRSVGLSLFTGQVTHRIAADVDTERDHILATLAAPEADNGGMTVENLANFSTGYHHRNGGGDRIETDGNLPIVDLRRLAPPEPEVRALIRTDQHEVVDHRATPITVAFGVLLMVVRVVVGFVSLGVAGVADGPTLMALPLVADLVASGIDLDSIVLVARVLVGTHLIIYLLLAFGVYRARSWARTCSLAFSALGVLVWATVWIAGTERTTHLFSLLGTVFEILVILVLATDSARLYARRAGHVSFVRARRAR